MKKNIFTFCLYFCVLIGLTVFFSCSKSNTDGKLQGKWKFVNVENIKDTTYVEDWEFKPNGELIIHYRDLQWQANPDTIEQFKGFYVMNSYRKFTVSGIENPHLPYYNTTWQIVKRTKNTMMIVNEAEGGLYFREFVKY